MKQVAFILCVIATVIYGFTLIPLLWCIPLTVKVYHSYKEEENLDVATKICILLFVSLPSGIILLCDDN